MLLEQKKQGSHAHLVLKCGTTAIDVECPTTPLTLNVDRTGCEVAVKGEVCLKEAKFDHLTGRSVILLGPPKPWPSTSDIPAQWNEANGTKPAEVAPKLSQFLAWWISFHSPTYSQAQCLKLATQLVEEADKNNIDPLFFASLLQVESAYRTDAVSVSGAVGLGQLMPGTAQGLGVDPFDPLQNLTGSAKMLSSLLKNFPDFADPRPLALASYNAGPNLVRSLGAVPAISQTTNYVYFIGYLHHRLQQVAKAQGALPEGPSAVR